MIRWGVMLGLLLPSAAMAGGGPWTLGQDDRSVYLGSDYTRWSTFVGGDGGFVGSDSADIGASVTRTDLRAIVTYGVLPNAEFEANVGWGWSSVSRVDISPCGTLGADACRNATGLVPIAVRLKVKAFDEFGSSPLTVAVGPSFKFSDHTRPDRQRLTALGDGQTDLGAFVAAGRSGGLGSMGSYGAFLQFDYRHRLAITEVEGIKVPGDELSFMAEGLVYPSNPIAIGLTADFLHRPGGLDWADVDKEDPDRFTSLSVTSAKVGGKVILRSVDNISFVVSSLATVYARNNPTDTLTIGVGVGTYKASPSRSAAP